MILHFLRRDFLSYKVNWLILGIITLLSIPLTLLHKEVPLFLGYCYFFFAMVPVQNLTGAHWRSQHIMSRNYLLSLPIMRKKMFFTLQIRVLAFSIPLIIFLFSMPFFFVFEGPVLELIKSLYVVYAVMVLSSLVWMTNSCITMQLAHEKLTTYLTRFERAKAWFLVLGTFCAEIVMIILSFGLCSRLGYWWLLGLSIVLALTGNRYLRTRRAWFGN